MKFFSFLPLALFQLIEAFPQCNSDRPGSQTHRTVYLSLSKLTNPSEDEMWANILCCVYTHVEINDENDGWMQTYDGSWEELKGDNFMEMAEDAYDQICDMSMGSIDCDSQSECVQEAKSLVLESPLPECDSDRPGSESHRTLYISSSKLTNSAHDEAWSNVLCCVYSYVEINDMNDGWMQLYDGSWEQVTGNDFITMAQDAYDQICEMYMGSVDCETKSVCVDEALSVLHKPTLPLCESDRPGSETHRTLYISESKLTGTSEEEMWANALCCVYTYVEIDDMNDGWMQLYDGSWEQVSGTDFTTMAQDSFDQICDMYMGSIDCETKEGCVEEALQITPAPVMKKKKNKKSKKKKKKSKKN